MADICLMSSTKCSTYGAGPVEMEKAINNIAGVVTVGIFAKEKADVVPTSHASGEITVE